MSLFLNFHFRLVSRSFCINSSLSDFIHYLLLGLLQLYPHCPPTPFLPPSWMYHVLCSSGDFLRRKTYTNLSKISHVFITKPNPIAWHSNPFMSQSLSNSVLSSLCAWTHPFWASIDFLTFALPHMRFLLPTSALQLGLLYEILERQCVVFLQRTHSNFQENLGVTINFGFTPKKLKDMLCK